MKKIIYGLLITITMVMLTACGNASDSNSESAVNVEYEVENEEEKESFDEKYNQRSETGQYVHKESGTGITINSDGTFATYEDYENRKGKEIGTYEKIGEQWKFSSQMWEEESVIGFFDGKCWEFDGKMYEPSRPMMESSVNPLLFLYVKGSSLSVLGAKVSDLRNNGFIANVDIENISVMPGKMMEIEISYDNAVAEIKAINPYENEVLLSECIVCSFYTEDISGIYKVDEEFCGQENRDRLLNYDAYEYTDSKIVYKKIVITPMNIQVSINDPKGEKIIETTGNADITFNFDGMKLTSFRYELTDMIYEGLSANVDLASINDMDDTKIQNIIYLRNSILEGIIDAFEREGLEVNFDQKTGEIIMNNNILFDTDSYELSAEGQNYLKQFMNVYLSVLLSDQFVKNIEEIKFEGHTDSSGAFGYNQSLSEKRAEAVKKYCLDNITDTFSEDEKETLYQLITAQGFSSTDLIYDEDGNEDANASRRVSIKFYINVQ